MNNCKYYKSNNCSEHCSECIKFNNITEGIEFFNNTFDKQINLSPYFRN